MWVAGWVEIKWNPKNFCLNARQLKINNEMKSVAVSWSYKSAVSYKVKGFAALIGAFIFSGQVK
jgi:hypothetical protein